MIEEYPELAPYEEEINSIIKKMSVAYLSNYAKEHNQPITNFGVRNDVLLVNKDRLVKFIAKAIKKAPMTQQDKEIIHNPENEEWYCEDTDTEVCFSISNENILRVQVGGGEPLYFQKNAVTFFLPTADGEDTFEEGDYEFRPGEGIKYGGVLSAKQRISKFPFIPRTFRVELTEFMGRLYVKRAADAIAVQKYFRGEVMGVLSTIKNLSEKEWVQESDTLWRHSDNKDVVRVLNNEGKFDYFQSNAVHFTEGSYVYLGECGCKGDYRVINSIQRILQFPFTPKTFRVPIDEDEGKIYVTNIEDVQEVLDYFEGKGE